MTATFESFGIKFLYPENWMQVDRAQDEGDSGITLEMPSGGFFSIEKVPDDSDGDALIDDIIQTLELEYKEIERDSIHLDDADDEKAVDLRFYYLDLLIVSRIILLRSAGGPVLVQIQAESRNFDENEMVFEAILKQLRA